MLLSLDSLAVSLVLLSARMFHPRKKRLSQSLRRDSPERAAGTSLFSPISRAGKSLTFAPRVTSSPHLDYGHILGSPGEGARQLDPPLPLDPSLPTAPT